MKKSYSAPTVIDYGSISDCTFATPALGASPRGSTDGTCSASPYVGQGSKNYIVLQCDKFGEYSHS